METPLLLHVTTLSSNQEEMSTAITPFGQTMAAALQLEELPTEPRNVALKRKWDELKKSLKTDGLQRQCGERLEGEIIGLEIEVMDRIEQILLQLLAPSASRLAWVPELHAGLDGQEFTDPDEQAFEITTAVLVAAHESRRRPAQALVTLAPSPSKALPSPERAVSSTTLQPGACPLDTYACACQEEVSGQTSQASCAARRRPSCSAAPSEASSGEQSAGGFGRGFSHAECHADETDSTMSYQTHSTTPVSRRTQDSRQGLSVDFISARPHEQRLSRCV